MPSNQSLNSARKTTSSQTNPRWPGATFENRRIDGQDVTIETREPRNRGHDGSDSPNPRGRGGRRDYHIDLEDDSRPHGRYHGNDRHTQQTLSSSRPQRRRSPSSRYQHNRYSDDDDDEASNRHSRRRRRTPPPPPCPSPPLPSYRRSQRRSSRYGFRDSLFEMFGLINNRDSSIRPRSPSRAHFVRDQSTERRRIAGVSGRSGRSRASQSRYDDFDDDLDFDDFSLEDDEELYLVINGREYLIDTKHRRH